MKKTAIFFLAVLAVSCFPSKDTEIKVYFLPWDVDEALGQTENSIRAKDPCWLFQGASKDKLTIRAIRKALNTLPSVNPINSSCSYNIHLVCDILEDGKRIETISFPSRECFWYNGESYLDDLDLLKTVLQVLPPEHKGGGDNLPFLRGDCDYQKYIKD